MKQKPVSKQKIFIWGAGGHGRVLLHILKQDERFEILGFIDDNKQLAKTKLDGIKILGTKSILKKLQQQCVNAGIIGIGDNKKRCLIAQKIKKSGFSLINAIDPNAIIVPGVSLGNNITIWAGSIINAQTAIKDSVIINCGAIIEHECVIKKGAHIGPGAHLAGRVQVGEKSFVGMGAEIIQGVKIGDNSIIGAGAVVLKNIPSNVMVAGIPAEIIKKI